MVSSHKCKFICSWLITFLALTSFCSAVADTVDKSVPFEHSNARENEIAESPVSDDTINDQPTPIVLWHGMGDTCCSPISLGKIIKLLSSDLRTYVTSLQLGSSTKGDFTSGYFGSVNEQVEHACDLIRKNPELVNGYHAIGFSQGAQFLRAVAQRCPVPRMRSLISLGGQHQGVFGLPRCPGTSGVCSIVRSLLDMGAYTKFVQERSVQAQYWHDSTNPANYVKYSKFIAEINNERSPRNQSYKDNLLQLEYLVLVMFDEDSMVVPRESSHFAFYADGTTNVVPLNETKLYTEDRIGLKALAQSGRLITYTVPGDHLQLNMNWFKSEIVNKFLRR